jgi:proteasome lid subunit RPN8/RPN11
VDSPYTEPMRVSRRVLDAITAHARRASPDECCGLLIGDEGRISDAVATENAAADPLRRYEISPSDYFSQIRRCRALAAHGTGPRVIGAYHSHPRGASSPSPTDRAQAFGAFLFMIAGLVSDGDAVDIRGYRLRDEILEEVQLVPDEAVGERP